MKHDAFRIDSHKLIFHTDRVARWQKGELVYPLYMEISPVGMCNHRCTFCSVDFMGYRNAALDTGMLEERLAELGSLGLKSIMYAGEGEPLLHQDMAQIVLKTRQSGIDVALTTNGVLLDQVFLEKTIAAVTWIKVSCNAGTPETYAALHRAKSSDFKRVLNNLATAAAVRMAQRLPCTLGIQILLLPENASEVVLLGKLALDAGIDYMVVKPYTHHYLNRHKRDIQYTAYAQLDEQLNTLRDQGFHVVFRSQAMQDWDKASRTYERCLALPFWSYLDAEGNVWGCSAHLKDSRFLYGNLNQTTFNDVWRGEARMKALNWLETSFDLSSCKLNCRMDKINQYLWELRYPPAHVNFI